MSKIDNLKLIKPPVIVTRDKYKILQVLDFLLNKYDVYYDCGNPNKLIYNYIIDDNINFENLLYYSKYYN